MSILPNYYSMLALLGKIDNKGEESMWQYVYGKFFIIKQI